jgi:DNA polymerase-3 subunit delta
LYFLHGEEAYFIDVISDCIENEVLNESERAFNQTIVYGKDVDHLTIVDVARRYPMMSQHQVVILKEAQDMKTLKDLQTYVERPLDSTILVICHKNGKYNFNSKFGKAVQANGVVFESKRLYENQVPNWIQDYLKDKKLQIKSDAAALIAEYLGTELSRVANELDKMAINLPPGTEINTKHIEEQIGISKDYNVFELQKALGQRDVLKANRIANYFASNPTRG